MKQLQDRIGQITYCPDLFAKVCKEAFDASRKKIVGGGGGHYRPTEFYELDDTKGTLIADLPAEHYCYLTSAIETELLKDNARGTIFDVGCGPGRMMSRVHEMELGFPKGFDRSAIMRELAETRGFPIYGAVTQSISQLKFDTAILFGNGLGMPGTPAKLTALLLALHANARQGARIIGESNDPNYIEIPGVQEYMHANESRGVPRGQWRWRYRTEKLFDTWHNWYQYTPDEIRSIGRETGWKLDEIREDKNSDYRAYFAVLKKV